MYSRAPFPGNTGIWDIPGYSWTRIISAITFWNMLRIPGHGPSTTLFRGYVINQSILIPGPNKNTMSAKDRDSVSRGSSCDAYAVTHAYAKMNACAEINAYADQCVRRDQWTGEDDLTTTSLIYFLCHVHRIMMWRPATVGGSFDKYLLDLICEDDDTVSLRKSVHQLPGDGAGWIGSFLQSKMYEGWFDHSWMCEGWFDHSWYTTCKLHKKTSSFFLFTTALIDAACDVMLCVICIRMHTCMYTDVYILTCISIYTYSHVYESIHTLTCIRMYTYWHVYACIHTVMYICWSCDWLYSTWYILSYIYIYIYIYICWSCDWLYSTWYEALY